eukprot:11173910-Lingulodinium_polyedra.AAC.1
MQWARAPPWQYHSALPRLGAWPHPQRAVPAAIGRSRDEKHRQFLRAGVDDARPWTDGLTTSGRDA